MTELVDLTGNERIRRISAIKVEVDNISFYTYVMRLKPMPIILAPLLPDVTHDTFPSF